MTDTMDTLRAQVQYQTEARQSETNRANELGDKVRRLELQLLQKEREFNLAIRQRNEWRKVVEELTEELNKRYRERVQLLRQVEDLCGELASRN